MQPSDGRRRCLACPYRNVVEKGVRSVRCADCRKDHAAAKVADAQWDRRARRRQEINDRRQRAGDPPYVDPLVRPRQRTPSWDQFGREVPGAPRLTDHQTRRLLIALDQLEAATRAVRDALGG